MKDTLNCIVLTIGYIDKLMQLYLKIILLIHQITIKP